MLTSSTSLNMRVTLWAGQRCRISGAQRCFFLLLLLSSLGTIVLTAGHPVVPRDLMDDTSTSLTGVAEHFFTVFLGMVLSGSTANVETILKVWIGTQCVLGCFITISVLLARYKEGSSGPTSQNRTMGRSTSHRWC